MGIFNGRQQLVPTTPSRPPAQKPRELHPEAQNYSDILYRLDASQAENRQLTADLAVERRHVADLQRLLTSATGRGDRYQRYAIEVKTHLEHIVTAATRAHHLALDFADNPPPAREPAAVETVEEAIAGMVAGVATTTPA